MAGRAVSDKVIELDQGECGRTSRLELFAVLFLLLLGDANMHLPNCSKLPLLTVHDPCRRMPLTEVPLDCCLEG